MNHKTELQTHLDQLPERDLALLGTSAARHDGGCWTWLADAIENELGRRDRGRSPAPAWIDLDHLDRPELSGLIAGAVSEGRSDVDRERLPIREAARRADAGPQDQD